VHLATTLGRLWVSRPLRGTQRFRLR
jgi:hypothetical protein